MSKPLLRTRTTREPSTSRQKVLATCIPRSVSRRLRVVAIFRGGNEYNLALCDGRFRGVSVYTYCMLFPVTRVLLFAFDFPVSGRVPRGVSVVTLRNAWRSTRGGHVGLPPVMVQ